MIRYTTTARIDAPPGAVWRVLTDVEAMPTWTRTMDRVTILSPPGSLGVAGLVQIDQPKMPRAIWEIDRWEPGAGFSWTTRHRGVRTRADHIIVPAPDGGCHVRFEVAQSGPMARLVWALTGHRTREYVDLELAGLATTCQSSPLT